MVNRGTAACARLFTGALAVWAVPMPHNNQLLQDVKLAVNRTIASFGFLFSRPPYARHYERYPQLHYVSRMLLSKLHAGTLHWRSIILTHAWFVVLMPVRSDLELTCEVVQLLLQHAAQTDMLFVKVRSLIRAHCATYCMHALPL